MPGSATLQLTTPIESVPGVGARLGPHFRRLGIPNLGHLVHHTPTRYERQTAETTIADLVAGEVVSARGEVTAARLAGKGGGPKRFEVVLMDHTGRLDLVWFNGSYLRHRIHPGMRLRVQGKSKQRGGNLQIANPIWESLPAAGEEPAALEDRLRPVYPASEDVPSRTIERAVAAILPEALPLIRDHLSEDYRRPRELPSLGEAYRMAHAPADQHEAARARRRLAYDELLLMQLAVHMKRAQLEETTRAPALSVHERVQERIVSRLPFALTPGQEAAVGEILRDLASERPANRLIQGDVGSGKTVVALYAMLLAAASRMQAALLAPTEILAEQHFATISDILRGSQVRIALLTGSLGESDRASAEASIAAGEVDIIVGTHALLTESVRFASLAVAVIDEQHRFGVHQRATLRTRGVEPDLPGQPALVPHTLVMTATPIPRTLALTVFGDLDVTTIRGMPPGRSPVKTRVVAPAMSEDVYAFVRKRLDAGEQAFVVAPAIDSGGGDAGLRDVRSIAKKLESGPMQGKRVAVLHGRLKHQTREQIMGRFRAGLIDVLVATTVIEVGVDVPNATVMVVEHAERFGLAQLHQLRGRVGRGAKPGVCVLIGEPSTADAEARLAAIARTSDGFVLAEEDLKIRGPGELVGSRQSGVAPFRIADLSRDLDLLNLARRDAAAWIEQSPRLGAPEEELARARVLKAYAQSMGLADVA